MAKMMKFENKPHHETDSLLTSLFHDEPVHSQDLKDDCQCIAKG